MIFFKSRTLIKLLMLNYHYSLQYSVESTRYYADFSIFLLIIQILTDYSIGKS